MPNALPLIFLSPHFMMAITEKNLWVAAGDGDLVRVQHLIESQNMTPNQPDEFSYTAMHAAASYGHIHVLEYLITKGGDVNISDSDGDTPIYVVEDLQTAEFLVEHGAVIERVNSEDISPIQHLEEDFPDISAYLRTLVPSLPIAVPLQNNSSVSEYLQNVASEEMASSLLQSIMSSAQDEPEFIEREVRRAVLETVLTGYELSQQDTTNNPRPPEEDSERNKRARTNGN